MNTDTEPKKKADTVAAVTTLNSKNDPIDQDKDAGATQLVAESSPAGNNPAPTAVTAVSPQAGDAAQPADTSTSSSTTPQGAADIATSPVQSQTASAGSQPAAAAQPAFTLKIVNGRVLVDQIRPHEENVKIYGDKESIQDLVKSIELIGIVDPIVITKDGRIISGHRRYRAAKELDLTDVPVRVFESDDELEIKRALLEHNRQRIKSKAQIAAEASLHMKIEKELAARRKAAAGNGVVETLPPGKKGKARDLAGKAMGISGRSADKAAKAHEASTALRAQGKTEDADEIDAALDKKGYDAGYQKAVEKGAIQKPKTKDKAAAPKAKITLLPEQSPGAGAKKPSEPSETPPAPPEPPAPASKVFDSDMALKKADEVLTFLRSDAAGTLTLPQERDWREIFEQIDEARKDIGL